MTPATVLAKYERLSAESIRRDMADREFLDLCDAQSQAAGKLRWTLSLAKVPQDVQTDQAMRQLMGDLARGVTMNSAQYRERTGGNPTEYYEYAEAGQAYYEHREGYDINVEYRYAESPLALGKAIMTNHALFAGLLHAGATPITDAPFHNQALALKLRRAAQDPTIQRVVTNRARARQLKAGQLAATALTDNTQLNLPALNPLLPLEKVLKYREEHAAALGQAWDKLAWLARRMGAEPWSDESAKEIEHKTIPDIAKGLDEARKARDAWLNSKRGRLALSAAGIAVGAAAAVLAVFTAPLMPVVLATAGLRLVSGTTIPDAERLLDWRDGKKTVQENGLHYLLRT